MFVDFLLTFSVLLLVLDSGLKGFCARNILIILGFSFIMAVIALIAVGLTQNKALPENVKVTQICVCVFIGGMNRGKREVMVNQSTGGVEVLEAQEQVTIY